MIQIVRYEVSTNIILLVIDKHYWVIPKEKVEETILIYLKSADFFSWNFLIYLTIYIGFYDERTNAFRILDLFNVIL